MREAQQNIVPFHGTFSRHGKAQASLALLIWLNENVCKNVTNKKRPPKR